MNEIKFKFKSNVLLTFCLIMNEIKYRSTDYILISIKLQSNELIRNSKSMQHFHCKSFQITRVSSMVETNL